MIRILNYFPRRMLPISLLVCAIILPWAFTDSLNYTQVIQTTYGPVRGEKVISDDVHFNAFRGIPFAKPPVGELRFQAPQPPEKWAAVRDSTKFGPICLQPSLSIMLRSLNFPAIIKYIENLPNVLRIVYRYLFASEDCLSLNVYTAHLNEVELKPVMVYLHGGGFTLGDSTDIVYGPDFLVDQGIVVVTLNYRLGALGFLATNTSDAPGNWGLKDQVAALQWVQDNIAEFGGDPQQVTIYGASSGAASVHFHMMSPLSKGLFHKGIISSGSAITPWAVNKHPVHVSKRLAEETGASRNEVEDPAERVHFLRKISASKIIQGAASLMDEDPTGYGIDMRIPFAPVVEPVNTPGGFITEDPKKQLDEGRFARIPIMTGVNSLEGGIIFMGFSKLSSPNQLRNMDIDVCRILPEELQEAIKARNACSTVNEAISSVYFGGQPTSSSPLNFTYLFGDMALAYPTIYSHAVHARYATKENPAYFYYFSYDGEWNLFKKVFDIKLPGVLHGGDINYVFNEILMRLPKLNPTSPGHHTKERMLKFLSNFAKYGNPTPNTSDLIPILWKPSTKNQFHTMVIDTNLTMEDMVLKERMTLWDQLNKDFLPHHPYFA